MNERKGNIGNTFLDQRTYKRAPLKLGICLILPKNYKNSIKKKLLFFTQKLPK